MTPRDLLARSVLEPIDVAAAELLARRAGASDEVCLGAALASAAARAGNVCVDLRRPIVLGDATVPALDPAALRTSPLVGDGARPTPLVLDAHGRLYLQRLWELEQRVARRLVALGEEPRPPHAESWRERRLAHYFDAASADQRRAAEIALSRRLCVVTGGPGTGKTSTVVKIAALLVEVALDAGQRPPTILFLAPTGKAAARLIESVRRALDEGWVPDDVRAAIPTEAQTIHRALAIRPDGSGAGRNADWPLGADVVIVDEASMVDLERMADLVSALASGASLILLGDRDQLASVEAGAVLADVCSSTRLAPAVASLTVNRRFEAGGTIGRLATAIRLGDAVQAHELLRERSGARLEARRARRGGDMPAELARKGYLPYLRATDPNDALVRLADFRLLAAHRRGPGGIEDLNHTIERMLLRDGLVRRIGDAVAGRPLLVTRNDPALGLANGDIGLCFLDGDVVRVLFERAGATPRRLSPSRLPPHEPVYAMTVHKSQGSEANDVVLALPDEPSPVLTRELVYTAVTRARRSITICGDPSVLAHAIRHPVERTSGLRDALDRRG